MIDVKVNAAVHSLMIFEINNVRPRDQPAELTREPFGCFFGKHYHQRFFLSSVECVVFNS